MKQTKLAMFIPGDTPPDLGFEITWYTAYAAAVSSSETWSGYFKPNVDGGKSNIMILGDATKQIPNPDYVDPETTPEEPEFLVVDNPLPITEFDISGTGAFSSAYSGEVPEIRASNNPLFEGVDSATDIEVLQVNNTAVKEIPSNKIKDGALIRIDNNGLTQDEVNDIFAEIKGKSNLTIENNGNADASLEDTVAIENLGGKIWENNSGIMKFQTKASGIVAFTFFINAGADVDWYVDGVEHTSNSNIVIFTFPDDSVKTIEVRGTDVDQGKWMSMTGKSLVGTVDLGAMTAATQRVDFSQNPDLLEVILPKTDGIFDQLLGYGTGLTTLRLDKLPGLVNSPNIQIRLNDCPNLDTDSVAQNILSIDDGVTTGRQFWQNGTTPPLSAELKTALQNNNWTVV